jgi:hypothetical protein
VLPALGALSAQAGLEVDRHRVTQVVYRPGRSLTVVYDCHLVDGRGARYRRSIVLADGPKAPQGGAEVEGDGHGLVGWVYPHDPALPGLAMWFDEPSRAELLSATGLSGPGTLRARSYRPGRRAVLELGFGDRRVFVKAVRPRTVPDLQARHRLLADVMPVPASLGWLPDDGVVVMEGLAGESMLAGGGEPSPAAIEGLLDLIPESDFRVAPLRDRVDGHARRLTAVLPAVAGRVAALAGRLSSLEPEPRVPAHGDLHAGQIMLHSGRVSGLIDVDTVGMGERSDDLASLIGHLHVSALGGNARLAGVAEGLLAGFERTVDRAVLRPRIAAAVFGYAAGPWTRQADRWEGRVIERLDAAEAWLGGTTRGD